MDGLISQADFDKTAEDATKVAGGAVMTSDFMKRVSLGMSQYKFLFIPLSQVRAKIEVSKYAPQDPNGKMSSGTGGNASVHYSDWIYEFRKPGQGNLILPKPNEKMGDGNEPIGHYTDIRITKSSNETTNHKISYPIRYNRKNGTSIWIEREVIDWLETLGLITKAGAWFSFDTEVAAEAREQGIEISDKYQGMKSLYDEMESNRPLFDFLHAKVRKTLF
jgi:RecA/RadA recombinase